MLIEGKSNTNLSSSKEKPGKTKSDKTKKLKGLDQGFISKWIVRL